MVRFVFKIQFINKILTMILQNGSLKTCEFFEYEYSTGTITELCYNSSS